MALIYDEIRGWHVVDDKPDDPPMEVYRPIIEGLEDDYRRGKWTQMIGRIIRSGNTPHIP